MKSFRNLFIGWCIFFLQSRQKKAAVTLRNPVRKWTHGLGQRWHQYMTDHSSISQVHPAPLVICTASCHSTQLLAVSLLHFSFFSFCPTFSVLFILLSKCVWLLRHSSHGLWGLGVKIGRRKRKRRVPQLICRRVSLVACHVFSFCFLEVGGGVVIMCWVVHSEGQINKESGSLFAVVSSQDTMTRAIHHFCP